ncbi:hypothetical protein F5X68DRAFT_177460 [Plectosphaerella plurivora]|uniref:Uncharacterized protein n=1 Tax=Plectosphaerella plurivora TaxID=936078 RepID=A0A9P8V162_9PEZI|nr:hypothetical protein F5X68DRAFT_177460 [Plectosphaerella plurivora]
MALSYSPHPGSGGQHPVGLDDVWTAPITFRRIRIVTREDIEATYPLITTYVENPSLALSVNEISLDPVTWMAIMSHMQGKELSEPARPVRHNAHAAVEAYARNIGLSVATTEKMTIALRWKMAHLMAYKPPCPDGFSAHNSNYAHTAATILLSLCKNVEILNVGDLTISTSRSLDIPHSLDWNLPLENYLLFNNYGKLASPGLQKLKHLRFLCGKPLWYDGCYIELDFLVWMRCFHRLPALESVEMDAVMDYQRVTRNLFPPITGSFKSLHVTHADMGASMLGIMMRIPRTLEEFVLSVGGLRHPDLGGPSSMRFKTLGKCLFEHRNTLRVLDLDIDRQCGTQRPEDDDQSGDAYAEEECYKDEFFHIDKAENTRPMWPEQLEDSRPFGFGIGPLDQFTALTHLSIGLDALLGWSPQHKTTRGGDFVAPFRLVEGLPSSVESLRIYGYTRGESTTLDDHLDELTAKMHQRLPNLKHVEGLEERIEVMKDRSSEAEEEDLWERPDVDIDWVRA